MKSLFGSMLLLTSVIALVFGAGQPAIAAVIVGDSDFETGTVHTYVDLSGLEVDSPWVAGSDYHGTAAVSENYCNMSGLGSYYGYVEGVGSFYQDVAGFATGTSYTLSFYSSGGNGAFASLLFSADPIQVTVGSTTVKFSASSSLTPTATLTQYTSDEFTVATAGTQRLTFTGLNAFASPYPISSIDNVSIQGVPEPSALVLVLTGLIALLAYAWRKRK